MNIPTEVYQAPRLSAPDRAQSRVINFHVLRHEDLHGNSGCGIVAEGVIFSNGKCVMQWLHAVSSIATFDSLSDLLAIHGHGGKTVVVKW